MRDVPVDTHVSRVGQRLALLPPKATSTRCTTRCSRSRRAAPSSSSTSTSCATAAAPATRSARPASAASCGGCARAAASDRPHPGLVPRAASPADLRPKDGAGGRARRSTRPARRAQPLLLPRGRPRLRLGRPARLDARALAGVGRARRDVARCTIAARPPATPSSQPHGRRRVDIAFFGLLEPFRGRGLGGALLTRVLERALELGRPDQVTRQHLRARRPARAAPTTRRAASASSREVVEQRGRLEERGRRPRRSRSASSAALSPRDPVRRLRRRVRRRRTAGGAGRANGSRTGPCGRARKTAPCDVAGRRCRAVAQRATARDPRRARAA